MIDLKLLRASPDQVRAALARRGDASTTRLLDELEALDIRRRALTGQLDQLKAERNAASQVDARLMKEKGELPADVRAQRFNRDAEQSGDFIKFLGLAGLGQAEVASITRANVDLDAGRIIVYRHKTGTGFSIPIFPQVRPLVEKLCQDKAHNQQSYTHACSSHECATNKGEQGALEQIANTLVQENEEHYCLTNTRNRRRERESTHTP